MTTESDAVLATIVDNWGGGGYAGATPKIQSTTDIAVDRWAALDAVIVLHDTLDELHPRVNDKFVNKEYTMDIRVTSIVSEDQLKLLVEETEYLLNNTAITGFTSVYVTRKNRGSSDRGRKVYRNDMTIFLMAQMSSSAIAPSGGTLLYDLSEANMLGSANAAWVNCPYEIAYKNDRVYNIGGFIVNSGALNPTLLFGLPLPTNKGSLKLYVSGSKIGLADADAAAYIDSRLVRGYTSTITTLDTNIADLTTIDEHEDPFTAVDCSGYSAIKIELGCVVDAADELDIAYVALRCYYDT